MTSSLASDARVLQARSVPIESELARRGINLRGRVDRCGPCPRCGGHDRFSINTVKGVFNCRRCDAAGDVITLVQLLDGVGFNEAVAWLAGQALPRASLSSNQHGAVGGDRDRDQEAYECEQHRKAAWLWSRRQPLIGSIGERYLREVRGITCALPSTLGFLPAYKDHCSSLIAAFGMPEEIEPGVLAAPANVTSAQITLLRPDGSDKADVKPNKKIVGSPGHLPIVLAPANDLMGLGFCEGVEDGLTVYAATGLGVWVAGGGGRLPALADSVPTYVEVATIYVHDDKSVTTGQDGARKLAEALTARCIKVFIEGSVT